METRTGATPWPLQGAAVLTFLKAIPLQKPLMIKGNPWLLPQFQSLRLGENYVHTVSHHFLTLCSAGCSTWKLNSQTCALIMLSLPEDLPSIIVFFWGPIFFLLPFHFLKSMKGFGEGKVTILVPINPIHLSNYCGFNPSKSPQVSLHSLFFYQGQVSSSSWMRAVFIFPDPRSTIQGLISFLLPKV